MNAVEFTAELSEAGSLAIPSEARLQLPKTGIARIIVLTGTGAEMEAPARIERPDPIAALSFAREHGLEEGHTDDYLKELRAGENED